MHVRVFLNYLSSKRIQKARTDLGGGGGGGGYLKTKSEREEPRHINRSTSVLPEKPLADPLNCGEERNTTMEDQSEASGQAQGEPGEFLLSSKRRRLTYISE